MSKSELIKRLATAHPHLHLRDIERIVDTVFEQIGAALARGARVELRGFGKCAAAHLDHDPAHCGRRHRNVRALCQRCHLLHGRPEHRRRIRLTLRRLRALGDLFLGLYSPS